MLKNRRREWRRNRCPHHQMQRQNERFANLRSIFRCRLYHLPCIKRRRQNRNLLQVKNPQAVQVHFLGTGIQASVSATSCATLRRLSALPHRLQKSTKPSESPEQVSAKHAPPQLQPKYFPNHQHPSTKLYSYCQPSGTHRVRKK